MIDTSVALRPIYEHVGKINVRHMAAKSDGRPPCGREVVLHADTVKVGTGRHQDAMTMTCGPCFGTGNRTRS